MSATGSPERTKRDDLIERFNSTCYLCGTLLQASHVVIDHIIPKSRGGTNATINLAVACARCDARKADYLLSELEWVSSQVKGEFASLKVERSRNSRRFAIFAKRVHLAALALTITTPSRLDNLIEVAKRQ